MIKRLAVKNYQSHSKSILNMHPGINIIQGVSDSGKSSLRRSIELVVFNRPNGTSYIKNGTSKCGVQIVTTDGSVVREKGKGVNQYVVDKLDPLSPGTDVPPDVQEILQMDDTNIQDQKDLYFLLNMTPGKVAKKLNEVVGLDEMDRALKNINSRTKKVKAEQLFLKGELDGAEESVKSLRWTVAANDALNDIQVHIDEYFELQRHMESLGQALLEIQHQEQKLSEFNIYPDAFIAEIDSLFSKSRHTAKHRLQLRNQLQFIHKIEAESKPPKAVGFKSLLKNIEKYNSVHQHQDELQDLLYSISGLEDNIADVAIEIAVDEQEMEMLKAEFDTCPFCDQEMPT